MPNVDPANFKLPSEADFYTNAVDDTYIKMIGDKVSAAEQTATDSTDLTDAAAKDQLLKTAFYAETPAVTSLGYHADKSVYFIKIGTDLNERMESLGQVDGDTLPCTLVDAGDTTTSNYINDNVYAVLKELTGNKIKFQVRFLGIDAPEIYHYSFERVKLSDQTTVTKNFSDIVSDSTYIYERAIDQADTSGTFIKISGKDSWFRYTVYKAADSEGYTEIKMLGDAGAHKFVDSAFKTGLTAQQAVVNAVNMANGEVYAMLDANSLNMSNTRYPTLFNGNPFSSSIGETFKTMADKLLDHNDYIYTYYNQWGMDAYGRFLGTIYLKIDDNWINLTKYVIAACNGTDDVAILPDFNNSPSSKADNSYAAGAFKLWTYDLKDRNYSDALYDVSQQFDDREDIQGQIFGESLSDLKTWTCMIGDNMFLVPPTSIRCVTQTTSERVPVMRARGTMAKTSEKAEKMIEMTLYFNGEKGINGIPISTEEAKVGGDKVTYYFNGLRPLLAMFKFTPFLPIENDYINKVLGIDAVSLYNIQIATVPGYPACISATIQMLEFNYRVYMPELPVSYSSDTFTNYFSSAINFKTMRYYYQKAILRGNLAATMPQVLDKGEQVKTQLKPMEFKSSLVKFQIADEDQLKKKLEALLMAITKPTAKLVLTTVEKTLAADLGAMLVSIEAVQNTDEYKALIANASSGTAQSKQNAVMNIGALLRGISHVSSISFENSTSKLNSSATVYSVILNTTFDYLISDSSYANLKKAASPTVGVTVDNYFNGGIIRVPYVTSETDLRISDGFDYDLKFMGYCATVNNTSTNENVQNMKNAVDWERLDSLKYTEWDAGDLVVNSMSISLGNTISKITVSGTDGFAPQFLGGQDAVIDLTIRTKNELSVSMLKLLPKINAYFMRTYRMVLAASPVKISSELTDFFNIKEVTIENVDVSTVNGQPGLFDINMRLMSIDRTVRNKEALYRIEGTDQGSLNSTDRTQINVDSYFNLNTTLQAVELYPDLELPTLTELNQKNFYFIRYVTDNNRTYVDPDFYFIYAHLLTSQIYREAILKTITQDTDNYVLTDSSGGEVTISTADNNNFSIDKTKDTQAFRTIADAQKFKDNNKTTVTKESNEVNKDLDTLEKDVRYWTVGPNITCSFLEKKYATALQNHTDNSDAGNTEAEGAWTATTIKSAETAAAAILSYLSNTPISTDGLTMTGKGRYSDSTTYDMSTIAWTNPIRLRIYSILNNSVISSIFSQININTANGKFQISVDNIIKACACAATGKKEYNNNDDSSWKFTPKFYLSSNPDGDTADNIDPIQVTEFGIFRIKALSRGLYTLLTGTEITNDQVSYYDQYFLDPYYNKASNEDIASYKLNCINSIVYSAEAFVRLTLFWMAKLLERHIIPSITVSMLRGGVTKEINNLGIIDKKLNVTDSLLTQYQAIIDSSNAFDAGIFMLGAICAMTNGDSQIMSLYNDRNYDALKQLTRACTAPARKIDPNDLSGIRLRKMILALAGLGEIKDFEKLGISSSKNQNDTIVNDIEQAYIAAADNPKQYWLDSFLDMLQYDHRGRMLRAFPVYYMLLIDEGRAYGQWKLHDNFYNTSSIVEMEISKSRKMPADTAHIVLSNVFESYSTTDEDCNTIYDTDYTDLWSSIWNPKALYTREEARRNLTNPTEQTKLSPGIRIHIRLGYGANAVTLPTVFNGIIAEVQPGEVIDIIAQGDGIELMNPVVESQDMYSMLDQDLAFGSNLLDSGATPKEIMNTMLTAKGGFWNKQISKTDTRFSYMFKKNPYGIVHFGDADYTDIFKTGEPTQNIYEAIDTPVNNGIEWGNDWSSVKAVWTKTGPKLTFDIFGKTTWDIFNICKAADPDFILGISPFGFRSTIFYGAPRYYYAYDYTKVNETIVEKRKPYQQYHIYTNFSDIIKNGIYASSKNIKTCAIGTYTRKESFGTSTKQKVGPMWADIEIYPENQKTMVVDTTLVGEGLPVVGLLPFVNTVVDRCADDEGVIQSPYRVARKMTASALKQSMLDMYTGEMLVIGDPTVKPHDRLFINDAYENMSGQCGVKEIVHMVSVSNGFTTAIVPDLIVTVDDKHEILNQTMLAKTISVGLSGVGSTLLAATMYGAGYMFNGKGYIPTNSLIKKGMTGMSGLATRAATAATEAGGTVARSAGTLTKIAGYGTEAAALAGMGLTSVGLLGVAISMGLEIAVFSIVTNTIMSFFERYAENQQVVQVFPLKRNGKTMTAGMLGSKGTIYGSPSYNNPGLIKGVFASIAEPDSTVGKILSALFVSDNLKAIGDRYKRDAKLIDDQGNDTTDAKAADNMCKATLAANSYDLNGYQKFLLQPRITTKQEMSDAYGKSGLTDISNIESNQKIAKENVMISRSNEIKPYIENRFFRIIQEESAFDTTGSLNMKQNIDGETVQFKAVIDKDASGNTVYDVPFLKQDAIAVLAEILNRTYKSCPSMNNSDDMSRTTGSFVTLKSALRVGDQSTAASMGYSFVISGLGECTDAMNKSVKNMITEITTDAAKYGATPFTDLFAYYSVDSKTIGLTVKPPIISKSTTDTTATYSTTS